MTQFLSHGQDEGVIGDMSVDWRPNLFVPGFPQCGTTALCDYLRQNPFIYFIDPKEPNTLAAGDVFPSWGKKHHQVRRPFYPYLSFEAYKQRFERNKAFKWRGEGSPSYIWPPNFPRRVKQFSPNAKVILMIREQKERLLSMFYRLNATDLQTNFARWIEDWFLPEIKPFLFLEMLASYYGMFGHSMRVILNDSLRSSPQSVLDEVSKFLEVPRIRVTPVKSNVSKLKSLDEYQRKKVVRYMRVTQTALQPIRYFINSIDPREKGGLMDHVARLSPTTIVEKRATRPTVRGNERRSDVAEKLRSIPPKVSTILDEDYSAALDFCNRNHLFLAEV